MTPSRPNATRSPTGARGVIVSLVSSLTFGLIYFLTPLLHPMSAEGVWAARAVAMLPFLTVVLYVSGEWRIVSDIWRRVQRKPLLILGLGASALLLAAQLWLFSWAPLNGRGIEVALGYFLLPLVLVVVGRVLYRDQMSRLQWLAAGIALIGVVHEIWRVGGVGWETLAVCLGYPAYFVLRRSLGVANLGGMWWEFCLVLPLAAAVLSWQLADGSLLAENPSLVWWIPAISLLAAFALLMYLLAAKLLSMSAFGLLSYAEPALLVVASLLIGERIAQQEWFTYGAIWLAVLTILIDGVVKMRQRKPRAQG